MKLVILSANYPFGNAGDNNFLKNEIDALSSSFDNIVILSTGNGDLKQLPTCVKPIQVSTRLNIFKAFKALLLCSGKRSKLAGKEYKSLYPDHSWRVRFMRIFRYNYMYTCLSKQLKRECSDADLVYSYWLSSRTFAALVAKEKNIIRCPVISRAHGFDLYLERGEVAFRKYIGSNIDAVVFISNYGFNYYRNKICPLLTKTSQLKVEYLGVNKSATEKNYSGSDVLRIVTCSNIVAVKRLDIIIKALGMIEGFDIAWTHFGGGSDEGAILDLARQVLDNKSNVSYKFMGACSNEAIQQYYNQNEIDLFINCSDSEGIPVSIMEAISFGIPVICRDVGGNSEINKGENDGYLLPTDADEKGFCEAIKNFYYLPYESKLKRRSEMLKIFEENFSRKSIDSFVQYLIDLAGKH